MSIYAIYDSTSGVINRMVDVDPSDISIQTESGESYIITITGSETDLTHYVVISGTDVLTARTAHAITWDKTSITSGGTDSATASSIINPSTVNVINTDADGADSVTELTVVDGSLVVTSIVTGTIHIEIDGGKDKLLYTQDITVT